MTPNSTFESFGYTIAGLFALVAIVSYVGLPAISLLRASYRRPFDRRGRSTYVAVLTRLFGGIACAFVLALVLGQFAVVVLRYVFSVGIIALQEAVFYFHALIFMLGAAYTLQRDEHVRLDLIYSKMSDRGRALVNLLGCWFLLLPFAAVVLVSGYSYVSRAWQSRESSIEVSGLPLVFLLKSVIILFALLLLLQVLSWSRQALARLRRDNTEAA